MKGFIFDFNGTLFQDADKHLRAWKAFALERCGVALSDEEYRAHMEGRNDRHAITYLMGGGLSGGEILELAELKEAMYRALCFADRECMKLTEGAPELFGFLVSRGVPRTIATASYRSNVDFYVEEFHLEKWFDVSKIIYDDGAIPGKPAPDFYLRASDAIGVPASECVVAEDSMPGVMSAVSAGAGYIAAVVPGGKPGVCGGMKEISAVISDFREFDRAVFAG